MIFIYNLLLVIAIVLFLPLIIFKVITDKNLKIGLKDRLTIYPKSFKESIKNQQIIWIHASSVGEVNIAEILAKKIKKIYPNYKLLITTMTYTGFLNAIDKKIFNYALIVPFDISFLINRFINLIKPKILLVTETEFWPNIFSQCFKTKVPIIVYNCRISDKSFKNYLKFRFFFKMFLKYPHYYICQNNITLERLIKLGVKKDKLILSGNIKFDFEYEELDLEEVYKEFNLTNKKDKFIITCGSTHAPEEEKILSIFDKIDDSILILAPRHPNRTKEVEEIIKKYNFEYIKVSDENKKNNFNIVLIDKIGYLVKAYAISDLCFIGGSLTLRGGHNPIEAIYFKKPVISGRNVFNFAEIYNELYKNEGIIFVNDEHELLKAILKLKTDKEYSQKLIKNSYKVYEKNRGAIETTIKIINKILSSFN